MNTDSAEEIFGKAISQLIHDIRNPLNIIIGFSQMIQIDENINPEIRNYVKKIFQSGMFIEELLTNIDYYVIEKSELEESEISIEDEIVQILSNKTESFAEKKITVDYQINENRSFKFSQILFRKVIENLFLFSMKGFKSSHIKKIIFRIMTKPGFFEIYYSDTSEPVDIKTGYFSFDEVLKAKRGLGPTFVEKYLQLYQGSIQYYAGQKWRDLTGSDPLFVETRQGFHLSIPV
jgi:light-regulated signal transduction histidine kinase (bacteriophytochrome)